MIPRAAPWLAALQVGAATALLGAVCSTSAVARDGLLAMLSGTAEKPFILRSAPIRAIGWLGELIGGPVGAPSAEAGRRTIRHALFGLSSGVPTGAWLLVVAQALAWAAAFGALWWGVGRRLDAALVGWCGVLVLFTPGVMQHYDPFVVALAAGLAATALAGRWPAFALLLAASGLVKESLPFFAILAVPHRPAWGPTAAGIAGAALARVGVLAWAADAPGAGLELHLYNNTMWGTLVENEGIYGLLMPVWPIAVGGALWVGARHRPDGWAVGALFAVQLAAICAFGRTVEARTWLELAPLAAMLLAGPRPTLESGDP